MPVVSITGGEKVGTIYDVLIDTERLKATALLLGRHSGLGVVQLSNLSNVGPDAITIENADLIEWCTHRNHAGKGSELGDLTKLAVIDSSGTSTGVLHDVNIDFPGGAITSLEVRQGSLFGLLAHKSEVPISEVVSIGPTLVTVRAIVAAA